jgi:energy-coupling factor transporter ATP-binding protein EcfA2
MKLQLNQVTFEYPDGTRAIDAMSCCINSGDKIAMLGANGAGKSTLFMLLTGLLNRRTASFCLMVTLTRQGQTSAGITPPYGLVFQNRRSAVRDDV